MSKNINLIDPRVVRTRENIKIAFKELLVKKTIDELSVTDITKLAKINRATFYSHYVDKYELFEAVIEESYMEYIQEEFEEGRNVSSKEIIIKLIRSTKKYYTNAKTLCKPSHIGMVSIAEKIIIERCKEFIKLYIQDDFYMNLSEQEKNLWISSASYAIIGVSFEYASKFTDDMIEKEACMLFRMLNQ